jgi:hypothetical protein
MYLNHPLEFQKKARRAAGVLSVVAFLGNYAFATPITYTGEDIVATTSSSHPNSTAAAALFDSAAAALGTVSTINFESAPVNSFSSLTVAPGVSLSGTSAFGTNQSIRNSSNFPAAPTLDGFNTTSGGKNFVEIEGGTLTFTFASPTQFFGAYLTGIQTYFFTDTVTFSDGTSQTLDIPGAGTSGSVGAEDFVGFTDAGKSISKITINAGSFLAGYDDIGIDDVRYQSGPVSSVTPEPDSIVLMLTGCLGLAAGIRRRWAS